MIRFIFFKKNCRANIFAFLILLSCVQRQGDQPVLPGPASSDSKRLAVEIPDEISLDSTSRKDSAKALSVEIVIPKSIDERFSRADELFSRIMANKKHAFLEATEENENDTIPGDNFYDVVPISKYKDSVLVSYSVEIVTHFAGGAHPFGEVYTFNYDVKKQKQISFEDYFDIKTSADSTFFIEKINTALGDIQLQKISDINFSVDKETITFIGITGYATGITSGTIDKNELSEFIRADYR